MIATQKDVSLIGWIERNLPINSGPSRAQPRNRTCRWNGKCTKFNCRWTMPIDFKGSIDQQIRQSSGASLKLSQIGQVTVDAALLTGDSTPIWNRMKTLSKGFDSTEANWSVEMVCVVEHRSDSHEIIQTGPVDIFPSFAVQRSGIPCSDSTINIVDDPIHCRSE